MKKHSHLLFSLSMSLITSAPVVLLNGCGFEVENPGNPDPKPKTTTDTATETSSNKNTSAPAAGAAVSSLPDCRLTIEKGSINSSQTIGSRVSLPTTSSYTGSIFVWRNPASGLDENVKDLRFGASQLPAGSYSFRFALPTGYSCNATLEVTESDINGNINLVLKIEIPE
jgi:hypothetical protein